MSSLKAVRRMTRLWKGSRDRNLKQKERIARRSICPFLVSEEKEQGSLTDSKIEEQIAFDLQKIAEALKQQPYRSDESFGLKERIKDDEEWKRMEQFRNDTAQKVEQEKQIDILKPYVISGLLEKWPARTKWASRESLLRYYPNLNVVVTRLISAGEMGKR
jgi:hypothetical protein